MFFIWVDSSKSKYHYFRFIHVFFSVSFETLDNPSIFCNTKKSSKSLRKLKIEKEKDFLPVWHSFRIENSDFELWEIHDLMLSYILWITLYILPLILFWSNLLNKPSCRTLSIGFLKSRNAQYRVFLFFKIWNNVYMVYMLSRVEYFSLKQYWFCFKYQICLKNYLIFYSV